jgi:hypothetical protein
MKQIKYQLTTVVFALIALLSMQNAFAQEKVNVNGHDVGSWVGNHWLWIAGVIIVLILLLSFSGGSSKRRSTKIERDATGQVRNVVTSEKIN